MPKHSVLGICQGMSWQHLHQPCVARKVYSSLFLSRHQHTVVGEEARNRLDEVWWGTKIQTDDRGLLLPHQVTVTCTHMIIQRSMHCIRLCCDICARFLRYRTAPVNAACLRLSGVARQHSMERADDART